MENRTSAPGDQTVSPAISLEQKLLNRFRLCAFAILFRRRERRHRSGDRLPTNCTRIEKVGQSERSRTDGQPPRSNFSETTTSAAGNFLSCPSPSAARHRSFRDRDCIDQRIVRRVLKRSETEPCWRAGELQGRDGDGVTEDQCAPSARRVAPRGAAWRRALQEARRRKRFSARQKGVGWRRPGSGSIKNALQPPQSTNVINETRSRDPPPPSPP